MQKHNDRTESEIEHLIENIDSDSGWGILDSQDRQMLNYAKKLTSNPEQVDRADIELLRNEGFDDRAIHDICCVVSYFAFVNRIADGLGVELEDDSTGT